VNEQQHEYGSDAREGIETEGMEGRKRMNVMVMMMKGRKEGREGRKEGSMAELPRFLIPIHF
jgi:hypothetical protein